MKVMYILKNILIQKFQHFLKSRLIQVMIHKMFPIQFVSRVNLIQMWLMKAIYNMKNIWTQEFQHSLESRLIEVMNHEMLPIQFVSKWIWFKYNRLEWPMFFPNALPASWPIPVQNDNGVRKPDTQNLSLTQPTACNSLNWANFSSHSTLIKWCQVRITNFVLRSNSSGRPPPAPTDGFSRCIC
jgi:hypothetical protein